MNAKQYIKLAKQLVKDGEYEYLNDALCEVARQNLSQRDCDRWHSGDGATRNVNVILKAFENVNEGKVTAINIWGSPEGSEPVSVSLF